MSMFWDEKKMQLQKLELQRGLGIKNNYFRKESQIYIKEFFF